MKKTILIVVLTLFVSVCHAQMDTLARYIKRVHDTSVSGIEPITEKRSIEYSTYIKRYAAEYGNDRDIIVGLIEWESDGFRNTVDKKGSRSKVLHTSQWCWGLGKLKVSTANDFARNFLGWNCEWITGRDLLYDYRLNIELTSAYYGWCYDIKNGNIERALNAYRAGPTGERRGNYMIKIRMPDGKVETKPYSYWVMTCVDKWKRYKVKYGLDDE